MAQKLMELAGDKRLRRQFAKLPGVMQKKVVRKSLRAGARPVKEAAKRFAPVGKTKNLRGSITVRAMRRSRKAIVVNVITASGNLFKGTTFYAGFQEFGWKTGSRKRSLTTRRQGRRIKAARRVKVPGKKFMERAFAVTKDLALSIVNRELRQRIEAAARKIR